MYSKEAKENEKLVDNMMTCLVEVLNSHKHFQGQSPLSQSTCDNIRSDLLKKLKNDKPPVS